MGQEGKLVSENEITYICKFHIASKNVYRKKFGVLLTTGAFNCFACGAKGNSYHTLFKKLKVSKKLYDELISIVGPPKPKRKCALVQVKHTKGDVKLPNEFLSMAVPTKSVEYKNALYYLKKRGVTRDDILRYNIGRCEEGEYSKMIIIPSYDSEGCLNFFQARAYYDSMPWHHKLPPVSKDIIGFECFINWNYSEGVTLCEGAFDAISIRKNAIPLFGKLMSNKLKEALIENDVKRVNVCLDNDALKNAMDICGWLLKNNIAPHLIKLEGKDPSVLGFNGINDIIKNSENLDFSDRLEMKINI
jgi:DNA primase